MKLAIFSGFSMGKYSTSESVIIPRLSVKSCNFSNIFQIPSGIIFDCIQENPRLLSDNQENF